MKAIEILERRPPQGLVMAQPGAIRMKIPLHRPRPHGQACARRMAMTVTHGIQDPIQMIEQAIGGISRARRLRASVGWREVSAVPTQLADHLCYRAVEGGLGPRGQAPQ